MKDGPCWTGKLRQTAIKRTDWARKVQVLGKVLGRCGGRWKKTALIWRDLEGEGRSPRSFLEQKAHGPHSAPAATSAVHSQS